MGAYFTGLDPMQQLRLGEQYMCHMDITVKTMEEVWTSRRRYVAALTVIPLSLYNHESRLYESHQF